MSNKPLFALTLFLPLTVATSALGMEQRSKQVPPEVMVVNRSLTNTVMGTGFCLFFAKFAAPAGAFALGSVLELVCNVKRARRKQSFRL